MLAHRGIVDRFAYPKHAAHVGAIALTVRSKHQVSESGRAAVTQQTTVGSTAGQTAQRGRPPLSESDQAALFLEFLRWKEQQGTANSHAIEPPRRTVNP